MNKPLTFDFLGWFTDGTWVAWHRETDGLFIRVWVDTTGTNGEVVTSVDCNREILDENQGTGV